MRLSFLTTDKSLFAGTLFCFTYLTGSGQAIDSTLANYLRKNQQAIQLVNGQLLGTGAQWLRQEATKAQFFFVGEEHDLRAVPDLLSALWPDLVRLGYRHVALETGQWLGNRLDTYARFNRRSSLLQFALAARPRRPNVSVPPSSVEDVHFFQVIRQYLPCQPTNPVIWGLDHEYKVTPLLERLMELPLASVLRSRIRRELPLIKAAEQANRYNMQPFKQSLLPLVQSLSTQTNAEIQFIADALRRRIWGTRYDQDQGDAMKQLFLRDYLAAQQAGEIKPKVLLRFGSYHAKRGLMSDYGSSTLANSIAELAFREHTTLFTLKIVCYAPAESALANSSRPCTTSEQVWMQPMQVMASYPWTLYNLLPLRETIKQGKIILSPEWFDLITGFDAVLVVQPYEPSTFLPVTAIQR